MNSTARQIIALTDSTVTTQFAVAIVLGLSQQSVAELARTCSECAEIAARVQGLWSQYEMAIRVVNARALSRRLSGPTASPPN